MTLDRRSLFRPLAGFFRKLTAPLQVRPAARTVDRRTFLKVATAYITSPFLPTPKPVPRLFGLPSWPSADPDSPAAISIPFATLPTNLYIRGPRYCLIIPPIRIDNDEPDRTVPRTVGGGSRFKMCSEADILRWLRLDDPSEEAAHSLEQHNEPTTPYVA